MGLEREPGGGPQEEGLFHGPHCKVDCTKLLAPVQQINWEIKTEEVKQ